MIGAERAEEPEGTAKQRHRAALLKLGRRCALAHRGGCSGRLQADHIIDVQRLRHHLEARRATGRPLLLRCPDCAGGVVTTPREVLRVDMEPSIDPGTGEMDFARPVPVPVPEVEWDDVTCESCGGEGRREPTLDELVADARNGWLLCEGHHGGKTTAMLDPPIERDELPGRVEEFAADCEIEWSLDRDYPP